jgi:hypothetical protein
MKLLATEPVKIRRTTGELAVVNVPVATVFDVAAWSQKGQYERSILVAAATPTAAKRAATPLLADDEEIDGTPHRVAKDTLAVLFLHGRTIEAQ